MGVEEAWCEIVDERLVRAVKRLYEGLRTIEKVVYGNVMSDRLSVNVGVREGSVLQMQHFFI